MARQYGKISQCFAIPRQYAGLLALAVLAVLAAPAAAQNVSGVVIDLSVINDGGVGPASVSPMGASAGRGGLKVPPKSTVRSRLYVQPKKRVGAAPAMKKPATAKIAAKKATSPAPAMSKPVAAKTAPKAPAAAPRKPVMKAKPAPKPAAMAAKAPPPAPAAAPAPPAPPSAPKAAKAPPPMPKSAQAPPAPRAPTPTQEAAAPAKVDIKPGKALRVVFEETATKLPAGADAGLGQLATALRETKDYRVQLMAYAGAKGLSTSKARRISLSRALAVRSFLIDNGVRSTQIDVRALGSKTSEKPANRVDINLTQR